MESDFERSQTRVTLMGTVAGFLISLASMFFLMSLAAALGFWTFRFEDIPDLGMPFWRFASAMWIISACLGAFSSVVISKSQRMLDGLLQAFVAWSGSYLIFGGLTLTIVDSNLTPFLSQSSERLIQTGFIGDVLSLAGALFCGWLAVKWQVSAHESGYEPVRAPKYSPSLELSHE